jgi:hypothetical protein
MDIVSTVTQMTKVENVTDTRIGTYPFLEMHCYHQKWDLMLEIQAMSKLYPVSSILATV